MPEYLAVSTCFVQFIHLLSNRKTCQFLDGKFFLLLFDLKTDYIFQQLFTFFIILGDSVNFRLDIQLDNFSC